MGYSSRLTTEMQRRISYHHLKTGKDKDTITND